MKSSKHTTLQRRKLRLILLYRHSLWRPCLSLSPSHKLSPMTPLPWCHPGCLQQPSPIPGLLLILSHLVPCESHWTKRERTLGKANLFQCSLSLSSGVRMKASTCQVPSLPHTISDWRSNGCLSLHDLGKFWVWVIWIETGEQKPLSLLLLLLSLVSWTELRLPDHRALRAITKRDHSLPNKLCMATSWGGQGLVHSGQRSWRVIITRF